MNKDDPRKEKIDAFLALWEKNTDSAMMVNLAATIKVDARLVALAIVRTYQDALLPDLNDTFPVRQATEAVTWCLMILGKGHVAYADAGYPAFRYTDDAVRRLSLDPVANGCLKESTSFKERSLAAIRSVLSPTVIRHRFEAMTPEELEEALEVMKHLKAVNEEREKQKQLLN